MSFDFGIKRFDVREACFISEWSLFHVPARQKANDFWQYTLSFEVFLDVKCDKMFLLTKRVIFIAEYSHNGGGKFNALESRQYNTGLRKAYQPNIT